MIAAASSSVSSAPLAFSAPSPFPPVRSRTFTYDANGNREGATAGSSSSVYATDPYNRLTDDGTYTYEYDKEGNLTRKDPKLDGSYIEYTYDHRNRLAQLERFDGVGTIVKRETQYYNADDRVVGQTEDYFSGGVQTNSHTVHYTYRDDHIDLVFNEDSLPVRRYLWSPVTGDLLTDERASWLTGEFYGVYWAANDHLGTVGQLLDEQAAIVEHREYDSFGGIDAVFSEMGGSRPVNLMFSSVAHAGRMWDPAADLYYNNARWYDPHAGRFISEDPLQFADGPNPYRYAGNDPINFVDPSGLTAQGNPLNNLTLDAFAGGYSGDVVGSRPKDVFFNPIDYGSVNSISTASLINSFSGPAKMPTIADYSNFGPVTNINSFNTSDPLYNYTPSKQLTSIRQVGGESLGDMLMGRDLESARDTVRHSTSMIESFNTQMMVTAGSWLKSAFDMLGPASAPSYKRYYSDGTWDVWLGGEPSTGDLLNQGLLFSPFLPKSAPKVSSSRPSYYNVADDGIDLTTYRPPSTPNVAPKTSSQSSGYWWPGRYSTKASQHGAYVAAEGRVFPTHRNSGLSGEALSAAQEAYTKIRLLENHPVEMVRGQAGESGYKVFGDNARIALQSAENSVQRALNWYKNLFKSTD